MQYNRLTELSILCYDNRIFYIRLYCKRGFDINGEFQMKTGVFIANKKKG